MNPVNIPFDSSLFPWTDGVWLVGGSVRDLFLGRLSIDYDIAVSQNPEKFANQLAGRVGGRMVRLGKPDTALFRVIRPGGVFDIAALKGTSIESDLLERDFTINAMAYAPGSKTLVDPLDGRSDLDAKVLKMVAGDVFEKDPIRLLRAFRICADYGFHLEPDTASRIQKDGHRIRKSPPERISSELLRIFNAPETAKTVAQMAHYKILFHLFPELGETVGCTQNRHHAFDVFQHTLKALFYLEQIRKDLDAVFPEAAPLIRPWVCGRPFAVLKWAMLLHDIGKPATRSVDEKGNVHFYRHEIIGAPMVADICRRLRFSNADGEETAFFVRNHIKPLFLFLACRKTGVSKRAKTRFFIRYAGRTPALVLHAMADIRGKADDPDPRNDAFIAFARELIREYFAVHQENKDTPPLLTGHDLIREFDLAPSPVMKKILNRIREAQLTKEIQDRESAMRLVRRVIRRMNTA